MDCPDIEAAAALRPPERKLLTQERIWELTREAEQDQPERVITVVATARAMQDWCENGTVHLLGHVPKSWDEDDPDWWIGLAEVAAAALRQPREGAERSEKAKVATVTAKAIQKAQAHTQDEWASLRRELDSVAEERERALARKDEWHKRFDVRAEELAALRNDYAVLVEHHRQCELAGTELCEAAKESLVYAGDGPSRDRLNEAMMTWDAHQWPEIMNAEMGDEQ